VMVSKVAICNLALANIGSTASIQDLDSENSTEAFYARQHYDVSRQAVLVDFDWGFTTKIDALALSGDATVPSDWTYAYAYPSDCLRARDIYDSDTSNNPLKFSIGINKTLDTKLIFTDQASAYLRYTANIENTTLFSPAFITALSWRLSLDISPALHGDPEITSNAQQMYRFMVGRAATVDANEGQAAEPREADWITGR